MFTGTPDITAFNNQFVERLGTQEGLDKTASAALAFVRARMREISFQRRIVPPEVVSRADCQRHTRHDTLVKIVDLEPNSKAMAVNFRGAATDRYINGPRVAIPFFKIESEKFSKNETELLAYDYPITKVIEENSIKDLQYVEDTKFMEYVQSAINVTGKFLDLPDTRVTRTNLTKLFKMIDGDELSTGCVLMNTVDWNDWFVQPATEIGSPLASEITYAGYKYDTILKRRLVVTNKVRIVKPGNIYAFTEPAYLGCSFILNDTKFWIKKEADQIFWKTWEHIGMGIVNVRSCAHLKIDAEDPIPVPSI